MILSWKYKNRVFSYITEQQLNRVFSYITEQQLREIVDLLHDPETERYLWFAPITLETFSAYSLPIIEGQNQAFDRGKYPASAIFTISENNELLGTCGIAEMPDAHNASLIGYQLKRSAWGKGTGTCSLEFLIHYAKTYLNVRKLFGDCVTANIVSVRVMEKCGFTFEGTIKEKYELSGALHDNSWFGLRLADALPLPDGAIEEIK